MCCPTLVPTYDPKMSQTAGLNPSCSCPSGCAVWLAARDTVTWIGDFGHHPWAARAIDPISFLNRFQLAYSTASAVEDAAAPWLAGREEDTEVVGDIIWH